MTKSTTVYALLGATAISAALCGPVLADDWQIARLSGHAWVEAEGSGKAEAYQGLALTSGQSLMTADRTRVMLVRGTESMIVGPGSVVAVSETPGQALSTTVLEKAGTVQFDVERQNVQHFSVETPMLAAVVKGTHFTVTVGRRNGAVSVTRGNVEVTALATGQRTDITPGQRASVGNHGLAVSGSGPRSGIVTVSPRSPVVSPVSALSPKALTAAELSAVATTATETNTAQPAAAATSTDATAAAAPSAAATTSAASSAQGHSSDASFSQVTSQAQPGAQRGFAAALASALGISNSNKNTPGGVATSPSQTANGNKGQNDAGPGKAGKGPGKGGAGPGVGGPAGPGPSTGGPAGHGKPGPGGPGNANPPGRSSTGPGAPGAPGAGPAGKGSKGGGPAGMGPAGAGPAGKGPAGAGPAGVGPAGVGGPGGPGRGAAGSPGLGHGR